MSGLRGRALDGIARWQGSAAQERTRGCCRFEESCSAYGARVLRRRSLPVAVLLVAWRVLRCNPVTARPGRRVLAVLVLSAFTTLSVSWTAAAVAVGRVDDAADMAGGCRATVGGRPIGALDARHPLVVSKGQTIGVAGSAPAGRPGGHAITAAKINFVAGLLSHVEAQESTGATFSSTVNVDRYLTYGSGVYRIDVRSLGDRWDCSASFFVKLAGSKGAANIAIMSGGLGALGVVAATRPLEPWEQMEENRRRREEEFQAETEENAWKMDQAADRTANTLATTGAGCLGALLFVMCLAAQDATVLAAVPPAPDRTKRVWAPGHTVWGFFAGLLCGLGTLVAGWQYNLYPLTATNIAFPVVVGVIGALRARKGRAYRLR